MIIRTTSKFRKSYKRMPQYVKDSAKTRENIFRVDPFDARLDTHKLHGKYKGYWAFTVIGQHRIMFAFVEKSVTDF